MASGPGQAQVGGHRVVEQVPVLRDHADRPADGGEGQVAHVDPGQAHRALVDVVEPGGEGGQRRLAGARRPDERHELAGLGPERHAVEDLDAAPGVEHRHLLQRGQRHLVGRRVGEAHAVELDRHRACGHRGRVGLLLDERLEVEHLEHPLEADQGGHDLDPGAGQAGERGVEAGEQQGERHHGAGLEPALERQVAAEPVHQGERQGRDQREGGDEAPLGHGRAHADVAHPLGPVDRTPPPRRRGGRTA